MSSKKLTTHNRAVKKWASSLPDMFYKSALAFGYPTDMETHEITATLSALSRMTRWRHDGKEFVSLRTLQRHLPWFEDFGLIVVTRHAANGKNQPSTYRVNFGQVTQAQNQAETASKPVSTPTRYEDPNPVSEPASGDYTTILVDGMAVQVRRS